MSNQEMSDQELIEIVVNSQVGTILAQRRYAEKPMAMPSPTPEQREQRDMLWDECIKRRLHTTVNEEVEKRLRTIDGGALGAS